MKEELVSFETAKLAKEKGFKEEVINYYVHHYPDTVKYNIYHYNFNNPSDAIFWSEVTVSAPTQSLLQKWLREEHGIHIMLELYDTDEFGYQLVSFIFKEDEENHLYFPTYEEALEAGLKEALKII